MGKHGKDLIIGLQYFHWIKGEILTCDMQESCELAGTNVKQKIQASKSKYEKKL